MRGADDIDAVLATMAGVDADIWLLQGLDYDAGGLALRAFAEAAGYPHHFSAPPNTGLESGHDLDGDGRLGTPRDAQGYGRFSGAGSMAILSRYPLTLRRDETALLWLDHEGARLPALAGQPFPSAEAQAVQRLSTTAHWEVAVEYYGLSLLTAYPTPPVFDGPEDRNGLRNADEVRLIADMARDVGGAFVIAGDLNLDPNDGQGLRLVMAALLADPMLQDPVGDAPTV
ncbi:MAG: endonuclease/exonuclease/phosphatase family protein, partial [Pseudomonadota bacterium]